MTFENPVSWEPGSQMNDPTNSMPERRYTRRGRRQEETAEQYFSGQGSWSKERSGNPLSEGKPPFLPF
jgi:hypothetical protein